MNADNERTRTFQTVSSLQCERSVTFIAPRFEIRWALHCAESNDASPMMIVCKIVKPVMFSVNDQVLVPDHAGK